MEKVDLGLNTQESSCGVYEIVCAGKKYVGSSQDITRRWSVHLYWLRHGGHHCRRLQRIWNKYGEKEFCFRVLKLCVADELEELEQHYMDITIELVNSQPKARSCRGYKMSEATKKKMSVSAKRVSCTAKARKERSNRAHKQWREGTIGCIGPRALKDKICKSCSEQFPVQRISNGKPSQSKYCPDCRPAHFGGYYKLQV